MTKQLQKVGLLAAALFTSSAAVAQTFSDFENLALAPNSYWIGATSNPTVSSSSTFTSGNAIFPNTYNGSFGGYWESGWAYSNMKDSTTAGYMNQYSARTGVGYNGSANYAIAQGGFINIVLRLNTVAKGKQVDGFYVTNSTFAAISMRDGDQIAKKFGGTTGNDPDWFKLKITKYLGGTLQTNDTVVFYLADFRFPNNSQDYIIKTWQYVNLKPLGNVDSLLFVLSSSDNNSFGMKTPNYFCMDNFKTLNTVAAGIEDATSNNSVISVYPNPAKDIIYVNSKNNISSVEIRNQLGEVVLSTTENAIHIGSLANGLYSMSCYHEGVLVYAQKIIKE